MKNQKPMIEARCKNCGLVMRKGNKMFCSKKGLERTFPYNTCLDFIRPEDREEGG